MTQCQENVRAKQSRFNSMLCTSGRNWLLQSFSLRWPETMGRVQIWRETGMLQMCSQMYFVHPYLDLLLIHIHKHVIFGCGNSGSFAWFHACRLCLNAACGMSWSFPGTPSTMMTRRWTTRVFVGTCATCRLEPMGTRKKPKGPTKHRLVGWVCVQGSLVASIDCKDSRIAHFSQRLPRFHLT